MGEKSRLHAKPTSAGGKGVRGEAKRPLPRSGNIPGEKTPSVAVFTPRERGVGDKKGQGDGIKSLRGTEGKNCFGEAGCGTIKGRAHPGPAKLDLMKKLDRRAVQKRASLSQKSRRNK